MDTKKALAKCQGFFDEHRTKRITASGGNGANIVNLNQYKIKKRLTAQNKVLQ
ncbi:hypothetical protein [Lacticaseibacillus sharpeae]|uniref:hypothetical protein n=1 Tax=Lacticaseibacillus sharpeae TaxID=1626 RepID=UPI000AE5C13F|nr:hypothetical protein [Lacticaseibacillus sharpeae]